MVTIHREHGLRFAILTNDHEPAHVHVYGDGLKANERRRAMDVMLERQDSFLAAWHEIHGDGQ